jgi:hypothetical protein
MELGRLGGGTDDKRKVCANHNNGISITFDILGHEASMYNFNA